MSSPCIWLEITVAALSLSNSLCDGTTLLVGTGACPRVLQHHCSKSSTDGVWWEQRVAQQELQEKEEVGLGQMLSNVLFHLQHPTETSEV